MATIDTVKTIRASHAESLRSRALVPPPPPPGTADYTDEHKAMLVEGQKLRAERLITATVYAFHEGRYVIFHGDDAAQVFKVLSAAQIQIDKFTKVPALEADEKLDDSGSLKLHRDKWTAQCKILQDASLHVCQSQGE